jgi:hypothetical protein
MISRGPKQLDKSGLNFTNCGKTKHTKEQYFQLVRYPEWFKERRKEKGQWQEREEEQPLHRQMRCIMV